MIMSLFTKLFENQEINPTNIIDSKNEQVVMTKLTPTRILHDPHIQPIYKDALIQIESEEENDRKLQDCKNHYEILSSNYNKWKHQNIHVPPKILIRSILETEVCDKLLCIHAAIKMRTIRQNYTRYLDDDIIKRLKERTSIPNDDDKIVDSLWNFSNSLTETGIYEAVASLKRQCDIHEKFMCKKNDPKLNANNCKAISDNNKNNRENI
jgi:hypothetical protein